MATNTEDMTINARDAAESTGASSTAIELIVGDQDFELAAKRQRTSLESTHGIVGNQLEKTRKRKLLAPQFRQIASIPDEAGEIGEVISEISESSPVAVKDVDVQVMLPLASSGEQCMGQNVVSKCSHHDIMQKLDILTSMVKIVDSRLLTVLSQLDVINNTARSSTDQSSTAAIPEQPLVPVALEPLQFSTPSPLPPSESSGITAIQLDFSSIKQSFSQALGATEEPPPLAISGEYLTSDEILRIKSSSTSRMNFAAKMNRHLFSIEERKACNVRGKMGKSMLDPDRIKYIKDVAFKLFPLKDNEIDWRAWSACVVAIDESNRRLNKYRN